jgi:hypothetical protein
MTYSWLVLLCSQQLKILNHDIIQIQHFAKLWPMTSQRRLPAHSEDGLLNNVDRSGLHVSLLVRQESFHATGFQDFTLPPIDVSRGVLILSQIPLTSPEESFTWVVLRQTSGLRIPIFLDCLLGLTVPHDVSSSQERQMLKFKERRSPGGTHDSEELRVVVLRVEHTTQENSGWSSSGRNTRLRRIRLRRTPGGTHDSEELRVVVLAFGITSFFVYYDYEEIKRELNRILIYECRCNERLRTRVSVIYRM